MLAVPEPYHYEGESSSLASRWLQITHMRNQFWRRWSREYLHTLQQRPKWLNKSENLRVNDLVLICNDILPPTKWPLARVISVQPGSDTLVRVVTLRTAATTLKRPIEKVCRLPIQNPDEIKDNYQQLQSHHSAE